MAAQFIMSSPTSAGLVDHGLPEIAFVGRSNVGKSSVLGKVLGSPGIVRTSRTPGRTQLLNLFVLDEKLACVDLPGYGYAKLSKAQRATLGPMISRYIKERDCLRVVIMLVDARREEATDLDRETAELVLTAGRRLVIGLTKIDLVGKPGRLHRIRAVEKALGVPKDIVVPCSAKTGEGMRLLMGAAVEATK